MSGNLLRGCILALGLVLAIPAGEASAQTTKAKLDQKINLENGIEANTPLKDALEFLAEKGKLTIVINSKSFEAVGVQKVEEQPVKLAPMKNVAVGKVLELLTAQVQGTYQVANDRVVIVAKK